MNKKNTDFNKIICIGTVLMGSIMLLPIIYCSFFNYATGDDLLEGAPLHNVIANHGSINDFFSTLIWWIKYEYIGWEGNWSSIILWSIEPSIWFEKLYIVTVWIALVSIIGGVSYLMSYFVPRYVSKNNHKSIAIIVITILASMIIQYMPYIRGGVFWYTGMVNYTVPFGVFLCSIVWIMKYWETTRIRYVIYLMLSMIYISGAGYMTVVLSFEALVMLVVVNYRRIRVAKVKYKLLYFFPIFFLAIGFIISAMSPGNAKRGGDSYKFDIARIISTILECYLEGLKQIKGYYYLAPVIVLFVCGIFFVIFINIDLKNVNFKHPIAFTSIVFSFYCSTFAPQIYAMDDVSGGVYDTYWYVFVFCVFLIIWYIVGVIKVFIIKRNIVLLHDPRLYKAMLIVFIISVFVFGKKIVKDSTFYICYDFIKSGQIYEFDKQMKERISLLNDDSVMDVIVPEMNSEQGPFMHMAITDTVDDYGNYVAGRFYNKNSVISVSRKEFYEIFND